MSFTHIDTTRGGDWSASCAPHVYILRSEDAYYSNRTEAADAAITALDSALGSISGYSVHEYDTDCHVDNMYDNMTILNELRNWRDINGFTSDAVYVLVHRANSENPGASVRGPAWSEPADVHVSATEGNLTVSTAHEIAHALIDIGNCTEVQSLTDDPDNEHELGAERNGKWTPFGGSDVGPNGSCTASSANGRTLLYSNCTQQAMEYSANHVLNGHLGDSC
ncbi:uncharacterized protein HfgLR_21295 (plasmid) [Haloferax gibbonsii]|jgi:hypothetical protein|uniref:Metalloprotease n=1 Tax=Haloferax gibbonsii TaxID=35746 RepID=A0A871BK76_HALGI|nr:hypothetical protein [Haloferax gibbonsii]QOS13491.1 uncharacterized protein HfgLR_21295 [Haloferax gibbonsii]